MQETALLLANNMEKDEGLISSSPSESDKSCDNLVPQPASVQGRTIGPTRRSTKGGWTEEEDKILANAVEKYNAKNWKKIAECLPDRTDVQCLHRWQKVLNPELVKGPWTKEEDDQIIELVQKWGNKKWSEIAKFLPGRIGKQCRERWHNHLNPDIKKTAWTKEEELTLIKAHKIYGNKWAEIAKNLHGRTENSIKNHWNCSLRKKLDYVLATGCDPYNYRQATESRNPEVVKQNLEQRVNSELDSGHETATRRLSNLKSSGEENCRFPRRGDDVLMTKSPLTNISHGKGAASCLLTTNQYQKTPNNTTNMLWESSHNTPANKHSRAVYGSLQTSFNTPSFGKPADQKRSSNVRATGNPGNKDLGFLCYKPLQQEDLNLFLETGKFPSTDSYIQTASTPILHHPLPSQDRGTSPSSNQSSPDSILRSLSSQFKNTPSIIRKRKVFDKPDSKTNHRNDVYSEKIMSVLNNSPQFRRAHSYSKYAVNGKLQSQKYGTSAAIKSVEKRLEHAFDVEWNAAKAITRISNTHYSSAANSR